MKTLKTVRLKPNPPGKDRTRRGGTTATQLAAEWVDIENVGQLDADLAGVTLYHIAYDRQRKSHWDKVMSFKGKLAPGQVMRIHAGSGDETDLRQEDRQGAQFHLFTGRDHYVWNNDEGECSALWHDGESAPFDKACYAPNPPEGVVLKRSGNSLVPAIASAYAAR